MQAKLSSNHTYQCNRDIFDSYDIFLMDIWGVIHDGCNVFNETVEFLNQYGSKTIIISNSPSRRNLAINNLHNYGIERTLFNDIYTSGEDAFKEINKLKDGAKIYHIGTKSQKSIFENINVDIVSDITKSDLLVITGFNPDKPETSQYKEIFKEAILKKVNAICVNPDKIVSVGGRKIYCSGYLASFYESLGGVVSYHGKPVKSFYENLNEISCWKGKKVLVIGDSLSTDIKGANNIGVDSLLVGSGIYEDKIGSNIVEKNIISNIKELIVESGESPTYFQKFLSMENSLYKLV